jgi:hypothetical protein
MDTSWQGRRPVNQVRIPRRAGNGTVTVDSTCTRAESWRLPDLGHLLDIYTRGTVSTGRRICKILSHRHRGALIHRRTSFVESRKKRRTSKNQNERALTIANITSGRKWLLAKYFALSQSLVCFQIRFCSVALWTLRTTIERHELRFLKTSDEMSRLTTRTF